MKIFIYTIIHLVGIMALFASLAAIVSTDCEKVKKGNTILHGVAMLLILVAGFGLLAVYKFGFPGWIIAKVVIWLLFGGLLGVAKRKVLKPGQVIGIMLVLGAIAAWLATFKPF